MSGFTDIERIIGRDAAGEIIDAYSGRRLYVPLQISRSHPLALRIGFHHATMLASAYGGDYIEVPIRRSLSVDERNRAVLDDLATGASVASVAQAHGISRRQVFRIKQQTTTQPEVNHHA